MGLSERNRKPNRLKGYDYSLARHYFVTVCAQDRQCLFGEINAGRMVLNQAGKMVDRWWSKMESKFPHVELGEYILMPNHIHGVVAIVGAEPRVRPKREDCESDKHERIEQRQQGEHQQDGFQNQGGHMGLWDSPEEGLSLQEIIQWFKTMTTNEYIKEVKSRNFPPFEKRIWQRSFYDHIIRDDEDMNRIREYIRDNPAKWTLDEENPESWGGVREEGWQREGEGEN